MRSSARGVLLALVLGVAVLAPMSGSADAQGARVFNAALFSEPDFIDPHLATSTGVVPIDNAYESLVYTEGDSTRLKPVLAESWTVAPSGRRFTFRIRKGVKFQDGAVLDAEAVKTNFERVQKINKGPSWTLASVESMKVVDAYTIELTVRPGGVPLLQAMAKIPIVSPKAIREQDKGGDLAQDYLNRVSAGTGPYRILSWIRGQRLVLKKFDDYWGGWSNPRHFTDANFIIVPEAATQRQMLEKGEIDIAMNFPVEALPALERNPEIQVIRAPGLRVLNFLLQYAAPPTNDVRVRRAVNYAFDAAGFLRAVENTFEPPVGPVPPLFLGNWKPNYPYRYDVARAKALLNEAGYNESRKARLIVDILNNDASSLKAAEILDAGLRATGAAELDIRPGIGFAQRDYAVAWQKTQDPSTAHHVYGIYTPARVPDPWAYLWYLFHSRAANGVANNLMGYANPTFDALVDRALQVNDPAARMDRYRKADQLLVDDAGALFVGIQTKVYALRKNVSGFFPHPTWFPHVLVYYYSRR
jgi:peptide/nickel transport system substrate-binding protein